jgi:DNA-binding MarR family transcriptional regulator
MPAIRVASDFRRRYPGASPRATESAMNLVRTDDLIVDRMAGLVRRLELTPASGLVLSILVDAAGSLPPHEIGRRLIVTRATVTGLVDSLERRGFVRRLSHPKDRRSLLVEITPKGRRTLNQMRPLVHRHQRVWLQPLSEREQESLVELLGRIQDHLATLPPER